MKPMGWLNDAEQRAEAATAGPWRFHYEDADVGTVNPDGWSVAADGSRHHFYYDEVCRVAPGDGSFIASVREDAPRAYALIRQLGETLELTVDALSRETAGQLSDASLNPYTTTNSLRLGKAALAAFREATEDQ